MNTHHPANTNIIPKPSIAQKLRYHSQRHLLEELVQGINETLSHIEDERSSYPNIKVMDIKKMSDLRYHDVLRDQQSINGQNYTINRAYTISVAFQTQYCTRPTFYDCIYYNKGEEHGISFLPHESLFDILDSDQ